MTSQLSILVIDDDQLDRTAIRRALHSTGAGTVAEADSNAAAFALLDSAAFDCILLDYLLPPTDGLSVLRELRARGITTPTIVLTGQGDERVAVELMKAGATDYLTKEALSPELLAQSVRAAVRVYHAEAQAAQALEKSLERLHFLAEAGLLTASLDEPTILQELSGLLVPALADWSAVDLLGDDGALRRVLAHPQEASAAGWPGATVDAYTTAVRHSSAPLVYPGLPGQPGAGVADLSTPDAGAISSLLAVPLTMRGETRGVLTLVRRSQSQARPYDQHDLALAGELAQRAAVAFDNAQLYQQARAAVHLRDEFLSIASHELRTPLTSLLGYVQLLERRLGQGSSASERERRAMRVIGEQVHRLNQMISALLDVSRLQSGRFTLNLARMNLVDLALKVADEAQPALDGHTVEVLGAECALPIMGDELRLHQVLQNLLQNATKYSPNGGRITIALESQGAWASLAVSDRGIGIPGEALPHLFNRFYRAANVEARHISGIGLGLYVVHEIVTLHGGTVEVDSEVGRGSTFRIRMPLSAA